MEHARQQTSPEADGEHASQRRATEPTVGNAAINAMLRGGAFNAQAASPPIRALAARMLVHRRAETSASEPPELDETVASDIRSRRGSGHSLDVTVAGHAAAGIGDDFSDVRIHNDAKADSLSRHLQAKAFTTGTDIFFRSGQYDPHQAAGRTLLFHELTHVAQQRRMTGPRDLSIVHPADSTEHEASSVADTLAGNVPRSTGGDASEAAVSAAPAGESPPAGAIQRMAADTEDELLDVEE